MDAEILRLSELKKKSVKWGVRNLLDMSDKAKLFTPFICWYPPGGHSESHWHARSESMYYIHFIGQGINKTRITLGWPPEKAKITEVDEPTMVVVPPGVKHRYDNTGTTMMMLIHFFAPNFNTIGFDVVDSETGVAYKTFEEFIAAYPQ